MARRWCRRSRGQGLGLIAFIPLIGLTVIPLQIMALVVRGLAFAYIGLSAAGSHLSLYRREPQALDRYEHGLWLSRWVHPESGSVAR